MDKLEGSPVPLSGEHTQALYQSLEAFADTFINSLHSAKTRLAGAHFEGKDTQIHIKQSFHSLLAIADEQFMEHVSAKPEPTPGPDAKTAATTEAGADSTQNTQKVSEKLKEAANISFLSCSKYIEEEAKLQAERGDRMTRMSSMNSQSMFATFRSDLRLPPIIDSVAYKGDRHLGLCRNYQVAASSNASSTAPTTGTTNAPNSEAAVPSPNLAVSEIVSGQNQQNRNPGMPAQSAGQISNSVPARPAGPGGIPPPPPMSIDQLMAHSKKVDEARKRGEVPPPPPFSLPQLEANSRYLDAQRTQNPQSSSQPVDDEAEAPQLSYKDQLSRLLGQPKQGGESRPDSSTSGGRSTPDDSGSINSSTSSVGQKMSKTGSLLLQSQMASGISKASGFFDDDEDDGETLIQRSKVQSNQSSRPPASDNRPPARNPTQESAPPEGGDMLASILTKKKAPTVIDESNPFSSRPKRKNMLLLKDENSDEEEADKKVNKKLQSLMNDSDDEDAKRKRLLDKYSSKTQTKDAPAEPAKPKKPKALQSSDEEPVFKPGKTTKPKPAAKLSDDEEDLKPKAAAKSSAANTKKKVLQDSSDEEKPVKPKAAEPKKRVSEPEQVAELVPKPQPKPVVEQPAAPKPEPVKKPVQKPPSSDEEQSPPKAAPKRNMDFLSKLNSQLGQGPKEGVGLIKSVVVEDGPADFNPRKPSANDEEEPSLLPQVYRSMRGSVDDKSSIKDLKDVYFGDDKPKPEETTKIRESMAKKAKRDSISEAPQEIKKPAPEAKAAPTMLRGNQKGAFDGSSDEEKPKPVAVTAPAPTMLRGNKKGAFDNSSDEEKPKPKAPAVEAKTGPAMLRGNQKGAFDNSSDEEPPKAPAKPAPQAPAGPAMLRGNQKGAFNASSDEEKPKPVAAKAPAPAMLRGNQKGAFDNSSDDEKPAPVARKTETEPARKNKLVDSDDEPPKPKASKPALKKDSSDEDFGRNRKADKGATKAAPIKKPAWGGDSDDEQPAKKAPAKDTGKAGKKKLFDDDD